MKKEYTIEDFLKIIKMLRSEEGCPWDREQTHNSLRPCMTEEAAELIAAIRIYEQTGNAENMKEELGDILLQVAMHSEIAEEEGLFGFQDVVQEVSEKMVRRHPHVFGETVVEGSNQVLQNWDEIKKQEKEGKDWLGSPLREIPPELPALVRAPKVQKKIDKLYEKGNTCEESLENLSAQIKELQQLIHGEAIAKANCAKTGEIIGNMLWEVSNISRIHKIEQEQILDDKIEEEILRHEK